MLQSLERQRMIWWMWFHFWEEMRDWSESERQHEEGKWANRFRQKHTPPPRQPPLLGEITVPMATQLIAWKLLWLWVPWQHIIFHYFGVKSLPALWLCVFCTWQWDGTPHSVMSFFLLHLVFNFLLLLFLILERKSSTRTPALWIESCLVLTHKQRPLLSMCVTTASGQQQVGTYWVSTHNDLIFTGPYSNWAGLSPCNMRIIALLAC